MPTGYTYKIEEDENYTARQYIEHCAHNFGLLIHLREENSQSLLKIKSYKEWYEYQIEGFHWDLEYYAKRAKQESDRHIDFNIKLAELKNDLDLLAS